MRIVLATADRDLRLAIELMFSSEPGLDVVGVASEASGLLALVNSTCPNLILIDMDLTGLTFNELLSQIFTLECRAKIVVLGKYPGLKRIALEFGAHRYVAKGDPPETLLTAVREYQTE